VIKKVRVYKRPKRVNKRVLERKAVQKSILICFSHLVITIYFVDFVSCDHSGGRSLVLLQENLLVLNQESLL
jgi:hypothetical protein